jgi:predicted anti-sigma-YlaC factor YlaD
MKTGCRQVEDNLIDFIEKKAPESLNRAIDDHLEKCSECAGLVERFSDVWEVLPKGERVTPPASLWPNLLERIQSHDRPEPIQERLFDGFLQALRPVVAALLLLFGLFFGIHLGDVTEEFPEQVESTEIDPPLLEEIFVTEYFRDFQDCPLGSIGDVYINFEIKGVDKES